MKKILAFLLLAFVGPSAQAGVTCSVPFNLQNGTTADATQVMANYNALIACLANAAAAGVNNDITALSALSTPITIAQGGTPVYVGGTSTGSANAQTIASVSPANFSLTAGKQVTFIAGFTNTNATTLNIASSGAVNLFRRSQLGATLSVGGELIAGHTVTVIYDGTQYQLISSGPVLVGEIKDWAGATAPPGWELADGSCALRTGNNADLFTVIGTTFDPTGSTCDSGHYALPDGRGRVFAGRDSTGTRITVAGSSCNGAAVGGAGCGSQSQSLITANMPPFTPSGSVSVNSNSTGVTVSKPSFNCSGAGCPGGGDIILLSSGNNGTMNLNVSDPTHNHSATFTGNSQGGVSQTFSILPPLQIVNKIIKF